MTEADLGVEWRDGLFHKKGATLLDAQLVNDPLRWARNKGLDQVVAPLEKALAHLLDSERRPEVLNDVITDAYESLESLAKFVTGRDKDLSANRELFLSKLNASDKYKVILKEYIDYAQAFRHGAGPNSPRATIEYREAESFVYVTGIFIRLAIE
jgi:hypothetical protein